MSRVSRGSPRTPFQRAQTSGLAETSLPVSHSRPRTSTRHRQGREPCLSGDSWESAWKCSLQQLRTASPWLRALDPQKHTAACHRGVAFSGQLHLATLGPKGDSRTLSAAAALPGCARQPLLYHRPFHQEKGSPSQATANLHPPEVPPRSFRGHGLGRVGPAQVPATNSHPRHGWPGPPVTARSWGWPESSVGFFCLTERGNHFNPKTPSRVGLP